MIQTYKNVPLSNTGMAYSPGNGPVQVPTKGYRYASVMAVPSPDGTGAPGWSTGQLKVKRSNSAEGPWFDLASGVTITAAAPFSDKIDCAGFAFLALEVSTAESSKLVNVTVYLSNTPA